MSAELFVNLPVLSFAEQMQIDLTHDRPVLIGIARQRLGAIPRCDAEMVIEIARCSGHSRAKKPLVLNSFRCDRLFCMLIQHDVDLLRVGPENADLQIVADTVWS